MTHHYNLKGERGFSLAEVHLASKSMTAECGGVGSVERRSAGLDVEKAFQSGEEPAPCGHVTGAAPLGRSGSGF